MEQLLQEIVLWAIKQVSIYLKEFKLHKVCYLATMELNYQSVTMICKTPKYLATK